MQTRQSSINLKISLAKSKTSVCSRVVLAKTNSTRITATAAAVETTQTKGNSHNGNEDNFDL